MAWSELPVGIVETRVNRRYRDLVAWSKLPVGIVETKRDVSIADCGTSFIHPLFLHVQCTTCTMYNMNEILDRFAAAMYNVQHVNEILDRFAAAAVVK